MNGFSGYKDIDFCILMKLTDDEIRIISSVNKYINLLCADVHFWQNRILNRIRKSYQEIMKSKLIKNNLIFDVGGLNQMMQYLGFKKLQELSSYLNEFSNERVLPALYMDPDLISLDQCYNIDRKKIPKFVNYDELIFYLRRRLMKNYYDNRSDKIIITPVINIEGITQTPGIKTIPDKVYKNLVRVGIRK